MTVRRKDDDSTEEVSWGKGTKAYRFVLLGAALAATPMGQNMLNSFGIKTPVVQEIVDLRSDLAAVKVDVGHLKEDIASVKTEVTQVKTDVAAVKTKSDRLDVAFTGFEVDFQKFRKEKTTP